MSFSLFCSRDYFACTLLYIAYHAIYLPGHPPSCLIKLPTSFVELYNIVNRVKGRDSRTDDTDDDGGSETAICLLTGTVMRSGTIRRLKEVSSILTRWNTGLLRTFFSLRCFVICSTESLSWNMYPTRTEGWFWDRNLFPRSKVHSPLDAQQ